MYQEQFEKLFENYLNSSLSEKELAQLTDIIKKGTHDNFIKEKINILLAEKQSTVLLDKDRGDSILEYILSKSPTEEKVISISSRKQLNKKIIRVLFTAAAVIMVFFTVKSIFFYSNNKINIVPTPEVSIEKPSSLLSYKGKQLIHLPDGSTIILNENSSVKYDQNTFGNKTREVILSGEAYFDIKHNEKKPFIVHTGKINTKVLGTAFNINAYKSSDNIEVTVERGRVQVGNDKNVYAIITPNQQIKVNTETLSYVQNNVKAEDVLIWKSSYLILDNISMESAISLISEKYNVPIKLANENIKKCQITASFLNEEDLDHIMKVICSVIETQYHYTNNGTVIIEGKGCE